MYGCKQVISPETRRKEMYGCEQVISPCRRRTSDAFALPIRRSLLLRARHRNPRSRTRRCRTSCVSGAVSLLCMGLWIYGHTCSRFPQRWLLENSWKNVRLEYTHFIPFINPLRVTPTQSKFQYDEIRKSMQLFKTLSCYPEHFDVCFTNWLYLFNKPEDELCLDFFQKTVPHLRHVMSRILHTRSKILETKIWMTLPVYFWFFMDLAGPPLRDQKHKS
jgi:hypothetical protein